jgi:probable phosphoglycerate mutase
MTRIWLIRHGEAHVNHVPEDGLLRVVDEDGLTPRGWQQAEMLRERMVRTSEIAPDVVVTSTFMRAQQTAHIVSKAWDVPVVESDDVQEWRLGSDAIGLTVDQALLSWDRIRSGEGHDERLSPGTETHNEFISRVDDALHQLPARYPEQNVVVFTHGGVIARSLTTYLGLQPEAAINGIHAAHTSITEWRQQPESTLAPWMLVRYNDHSHLLDREPPS